LDVPGVHALAAQRFPERDSQVVTRLVDPGKDLEPRGSSHRAKLGHDLGLLEDG
jgi:hypothetical protein